MPINKRPSKPPAFQFYVKDWLSSPNVRAMTYAQRGLYIELLAYTWPAGVPAAIVGHKLAGMTEAEWNEISPLVLAQFEQTRDGRLVNPKLDEQFKELDSFYKMQSDKGKRGADARWHGSANARPLPNDGSSSSSSTASSPSSEEDESTREGGMTGAEPEPGTFRVSDVNLEEL
jgi:uncharacterized protein YdaU (DUF1376 family)